MDPLRFYRFRYHQLNSALALMKKWDRGFVAAKLIFALLMPLVFLVDAFRSQPLMIAVPGMTVLLFLFHEPLLKRIKSVKARMGLMLREQNSLFGKGNDLPPSWIKTDGDHAFDADLNISGENGLFVFVSRCITRSGQKRLQQWLLEGAIPHVRRLRQEAVLELKQCIRFRESFFSADVGINENIKDDRNWLGLEELYLKKVIPRGFFALPLMTIVLIVLGAWKGVFLLFFLQLFVNLFTFRAQQKIIKESKGVWHEIRQYRQLLLLIEKEPFAATQLSHLQESLTGDKEVPSRLLRRLERALQSLEMRGSAIHPLINNLLFWDLFWITRLQYWMTKWNKKLEGWIDVCAEIEALGSIATMSFNYPTWTNPIFIEKNLNLEIDDLGHPLLSAGHQTLNACSIPGPHHLFFVSGPNMAGKSTFLRSVGTAVVMAQAGMPVCARKMKMGQMSLVTSLSHSDSLTEGKSLFHKELDRLIKIWEGNDKYGLPVFFLIDEMLRGTNPVDRYHGSLWVLRLLARRMACGIVATHDLRLTSLKDCENTQLTLQNHHFSCTITADNCSFDYCLHPGTAPSVNALPLMRQRGLPIPDGDQ